jgi:hypothetical protein
MFYSLDWFQVYLHVPMIYYKCCYINESKISTQIWIIILEYENLSNDYNYFGAY